MKTLQINCFTQVFGLVGCILFLCFLRCGRSPGHAVFRLEEGLGRPSPRWSWAGARRPTWLGKTLIKNPDDLLESNRWLKLSRSHACLEYIQDQPEVMFLAFLHLFCDMYWTSHLIQQYGLHYRLLDDYKTIRYVGICPRKTPVFRPRVLI